MLPLQSDSIATRFPKSNSLLDLTEVRNRQVYCKLRAHFQHFITVELI
jgi:hypothetical protein